MATEALSRDPLTGLTARQVASRVEAGKLNVIPDGPSRTTKTILSDNIFTRFNLILTVLLVIILIVAPIQDAPIRSGDGHQRRHRHHSRVAGQANA